MGRCADLRRRKGRKLSKDVMLHHFNHPNGITGITQDAIQVLFGRGIFVRNQSVRSVASMTRWRRWGSCSSGSATSASTRITSTFDMVKASDMRTTLQTRSTSKNSSRIDGGL